MRLHTLVAIALMPVAAAAQTSQSPDALARGLQQHYDRVRDFSAEFVQTYRGGVLRTSTEERGSVWIKKPGLMRWVYRSPEHKEFVSDGVSLYAYLPEDRQVRVEPVPKGDEASAGIMFLTGRGDVVKDFTASTADSPITGTVGLTLTPRRAEAGYTHLVVALDPQTFQIRALTTRDEQGGDSTIRFINLKENTGISDKTFVFDIPRGVDVISHGLPN